MFQRLIPVVLGVLALLSTASCDGDYDVAERELFVRYLAKEDALLVLEVQHGIDGNAAAGSAAVKALTRALTGGRVFPPEGGLICLDLDMSVGEPEPAKQREHDDWVEFAASVRVEEARMFVDSKKHLSFLRLSRVSRFQRVLALRNTYLNRELADDHVWSKPLAPEFPIYDQSTYDALRSAIGRGHAWVRVEGEALVIDIPMSGSNAARCLARLKDCAREARAPRESWAVDWLDEVTSIEIDPSRVLLRFGEAPHRVGHFVFEGETDEVDYAPLTESLKKLAIPIGDARDLERLRAKLEPPAAQIRSK